MDLFDDDGFWIEDLEGVLEEIGGVGCVDFEKIKVDLERGLG